MESLISQPSNNEGTCQKKPNLEKKIIKPNGLPKSKDTLRRGIITF